MYQTDYNNSAGSEGSDSGRRPASASSRSSVSIPTPGEAFVVMMIAMGNSSDPPRGILANEDFLKLASVPCPRATFAGPRGACGEDEERLRMTGLRARKSLTSVQVYVRTDYETDRDRARKSAETNGRRTRR